MEKIYQCWYCNAVLKSHEEIMTHYWTTSDYCHDQEDIRLIEVK